jgi:ubiquitin conjugation factor E4 B
VLTFVQSVEDSIKTQKDNEDVYGDAPDRYLDPILCTIMEDPVILPSSRMTLDFSTLKSHLLSDSNDPFNRQALKLEDVVRGLFFFYLDDVLRDEILAWKIERRGGKK